MVLWGILIKVGPGMTSLKKCTAGPLPKQSVQKQATHLTEFHVWHQIEFFDGLQVVMQLTDGGHEGSHHVVQNIGHLQQDSHHGLHVFREHQLQERESQNFFSFLPSAPPLEKKAPLWASASPCRWPSLHCHGGPSAPWGCTSAAETRSRGRLRRRRRRRRPWSCSGADPAARTWSVPTNIQKKKMMMKRWTWSSKDVWLNYTAMQSMEMSELPDVCSVFR